MKLTDRFHYSTLVVAAFMGIYCAPLWAEDSPIEQILIKAISDEKSVAALVKGVDRFQEFATALRAGVAPSEKDAVEELAFWYEGQPVQIESAVWGSSSSSRLILVADLPGFTALSEGSGIENVDLNVQGSQAFAVFSSALSVEIPNQFEAAHSLASRAGLLTQWPIYTTVERKGILKIDTECTVAPTQSIPACSIKDLGILRNVIRPEIKRILLSARSPNNVELQRFKDRLSSDFAKGLIPNLIALLQRSQDPVRDAPLVFKGTKSLNSSCLDSDPAQDPSVVGRVTLIQAGVPGIPLKDHCNSTDGKIIQYACPVGSAQPKAQVRNCKKGYYCGEGACRIIKGNLLFDTSNAKPLSLKQIAELKKKKIKEVSFRFATKIQSPRDLDKDCKHYIGAQSQPLAPLRIEQAVECKADQRCELEIPVKLDALLSAKNFKGLALTYGATATCGLKDKQKTTLLKLLK